MDREVVIIGGGGHGSVVADIINGNQDRVIGFLDDNLLIGAQILNKNVLGTISQITKMAEDYANLEFIIAIGNNATREAIATNKVNFYTAIHRTAIIGADCKIEEGCILCAGSIIGVESVIEKHCIINTKSCVDHNCSVGCFSHLCPGVTVAGSVNIGKSSMIGTGVSIINNIEISKNTIVGAGAVVTKNIYDPGTYIGIPARKLHCTN